MSSDFRNALNNSDGPSVNTLPVSDARAGDVDQSTFKTAATDTKLAIERTVAATPPSTPGELLRAAREIAGLSIGDIATRLRMAARQIDALEKSDYANLPSGTFLRGFVRNYAKSVQIDPMLAITLLEKTHSIAAVTKPAPIVVPSQGIKINISSNELASTKIRIAILVGVLVLLGGAVWYWWEYMRPGLPEGGRAKPAAEVIAARDGSAALPPSGPFSQPFSQPVSQPLSQLGTPPLSPAVQPSISGMTAPDAALKEDGAALNVAASNTPNPSIGGPSEPVSAATAGAVQTLPSKTVASAPTSAASSSAPTSGVESGVESGVKAAKTKDPKTTIAGKGGSSLGFTFSGESWVEVVDSTGKTILSRRYKAGEADEVSGRAPFSVVIGKAGVTRMAYNGKEFDLAPHTKLSVARISVK